MKWIASFALSLALSACGGPQAVSQRVENTPAEVIAPLLGAASDAGDFIPGLKIVMSRPSDSEVLYTIPGDGTAAPSTILFHLSALDGGSATQVNAFVDVPPITAFVDGKKMVLSEAKVREAVGTILAGLAKDSSSFSAHTRLSEVLAALAISTDSKIRDQATRLASGSSPQIYGMLEDESYDIAASGPDDLAPTERNDPTEFDSPQDESEQYSEDF